MDSDQQRTEQRPRKRSYFFTATPKQVAMMDITQGPLTAIKKEIPWSVEPSSLDTISFAIRETSIGLALVGTGDDAFLYQLPDEACTWLRQLVPEDPQLALADIETVVGKVMQNPAIASEFKKMGIVGLLLALRSYALRAAKSETTRFLYYWFTPHSKHLGETLHRLAGINSK